MLTIQDRPLRLCDGISRRDWLRIGGLGSLGAAPWAWNAPGRALGATTPGSASPITASGGKAKACIMLFFLGGPPQHETWDPKPEAPAEIRGDLGNIESRTPGLRVGELMPRVAQLTDKICVLRAVATNDNAHSSSGYWMLTGTPHQPTNSESAPPGAPNDSPCVGAIVKHLRSAGNGLPSAVTLPEHIWNTGGISWPGQDAGWLGRSADPWLMKCDPSSPEFQIPELSLPAELPPVRLQERQTLLQSLTGHLDAMQTSGVMDRFDQQRRQACDLLGSSQSRQAFELDREPASVRDRYGRTRFGQSVLLARRLVEAGVSLVQVNWTRTPDDQAVNPVWDTHAKNSERLRTALMPSMDQTYSALLEDLAERGMLDETLVVWAGEFGRTPKINAVGGRDHWGYVFSVALAGGGVRGGQVLGASDAIGAYPKEGRVSAQDLTATLFHCLGHSPQTEIHDRLGRPMLISRGDVITSVF